MAMIMANLLPDSRAGARAVPRIARTSMVVSILLLSLLTLLPVNSFAAKLASGRVNVDSAGTPEALSTTSNKCDIIYVTAGEGNADIIVVGESDVDATQATRTGTTLFPGQTIAFPHSNTVSIYVDVETNDDDAEWLCIDK